jgi:hypothetical protein
MKRTRSPKPKQRPTSVGFDAEVLIAAAQEAIREALAQHKAHGNSVVVWRDGQVVILRPEEIEI